MKHDEIDYENLTFSFTETKSMYVSKCKLEEEWKMARRNVSGPRRPGGMPRAEADEVVAQIERSADGRFAGRLAGAVATTLAPKEVFSDKQQRVIEKPSVAGATWAADLIDARNLGAESGFALVAIDIATRKAPGVLMNGKTTRDILRAFQEILPASGARTHLDAGGPSKLILDQERGWRTPAFLAFLAERGIGAHFKEDKFAANALAPVDNLIKRIKQYLRKRLTEEQLDTLSLIHI